MRARAVRAARRGDRARGGGDACGREGRGGEIRSDAETEADRITNEARDEARVAIDEVQAFLDRVDEETRTIPAAAEERRRQMTEETRMMQERLLSIAKALDSVLDTRS